MSQQYRASKSDEIIQRELDSMTLIYQRKSGITHIVADPIPAILEIMGDRPMAVEAIVRDMSDAFDIKDDGNISDIVCARIEELCQLGLTELVAE